MISTRDLLYVSILLFIVNVIVNYDISIREKGFKENNIDLDNDLDNDDYKSLDKMFKYSMEKTDMFNMIIRVDTKNHIRYFSLCDYSKNKISKDRIAVKAKYSSSHNDLNKNIR